MDVMLTVAIHQEDDGTYWAKVNELPGCYASGVDLDELREAINEAIHLYLEDENGQVPAESLEGLTQVPTVPTSMASYRVKRAPQLQVDELRARYHLDADLIEA